MIDLGSIASLRAHDHELHAFCGTCDRWAVIALGAMVRAGHSDRRATVVSSSCAMG